MDTTCPTVKVKADNELGFKLINEEDFVEGEYELYVEPVVEGELTKPAEEVKPAEVTTPAGVPSWMAGQPQ